jgi:ZIP family zinc transporter
VAFFDLLPEAIDIVGKPVTLAVALGFIAYLILDRMIGLHAHPHVHHDDHQHEHEHEHVSVGENQNRGFLRAASLCLHSLLDGVAIGLSFQLSAALGAVVAVAVLAHDFSDGINTVTAILKGGAPTRKAMRWLVIDAVAPVVGIVSTLFFVVPEHTLGLILGVFCGFFLYIGASDLIPESYHAHPTKWTTFMTVLGATLIYVVISVAG